MSETAVIGGVIRPRDRQHLADLADQSLRIATSVLGGPLSAFCLRGAATLLPDPALITSMGAELPDSDQLAERVDRAREALELLAQAVEYMDLYEPLMARVTPSAFSPGEMPDEWRQVRREALRKASAAVGAARAGLFRWGRGEAACV